MATGVVRATIPVAIQPGTRLLQMHYEEATSTWILWLHHDLQMQYGTFLRLGADGSIERVVRRPDGTDDVFRVREKAT